MPTVLVTGGAGFIGSHVALMAKEEGWSVRILDNLSTGLESNCERLRTSGVDVVIGDVRDREVVHQAVEGCDAVVNLAAQISVPRSIEYPEENHDINIGGLACLLAACQHHGVRRIITASSAAVYGHSEAFPLEEGDAGSFHSPYAASKWENEQQISRAKAQGFEAVALRFFNVYGPHQRPDGAYAAVIPKFIDLVLSEKAPTIFGDGLQTRDFVHVSDVARAIMMFCQTSWDSSFDDVYNVSTQTEVSLLGLLGTIHRLMEELVPSLTLHAPAFAPERQGDISRSVGSNQRLCSGTHWKPTTSLEEGLRSQLLEVLHSR
jgi:nucleoside-diphosphate-sugar epimerase